MNEVATGRKLSAPTIQASGWNDDPHSVPEQSLFTCGRIVIQDSRATRRLSRRAGCRLRCTRDFTASAVEVNADKQHKFVSSRAFKGEL